MLWDGSVHGMGKVWVASKDEARAANVGLAVNCADFQTTYQPGVSPYWLHISYHGKIDRVTWYERVVRAIQHVLEALLAGKDVVIHCLHGQSGNQICLRT